MAVNKEYYETDKTGNQIYAVNNEGDQYYIETEDPEEKYAKLSNGLRYYAKLKDGSEYYAKWDGHDMYLMNNGNQIYAKNSNNIQIYGKRSNGEPIIALSNTGKPSYARDFQQNEIYPIGVDNSDYMIGNTFAKTSSGTLIYPKNEHRKPAYPIDDMNNEVYLMSSNDSVQFGTDDEGNQYYIKDSFGNEVYPDTKEYAKTKDGLPIYAKTRLGKIIYLRNFEGDEFYFETDTGSVIENDYPYAKNSKNTLEIYPTIIINNKRREIPIGNNYAKNENGEPYYPIDSFGNEYIPDGFDVLKNYPITRDGFVIVPSKNDRPNILNGIKPNIERDNIVGKVKRDTGKEDFLTNIKSIQTPRKPTISTAILQKQKKETGNIFYYYIGILIMLILMICIKLIV